MGKTTNIAWCDRTHNWFWGCHEVTDEECGGCYARDYALRLGWNDTTGAKPILWGAPHKTTRRVFGDKHNAEPYLWNAEAMRNGERLCVFTSSMADLFEFHPQLNAPRQVAFRTVENTPYLDWKMLTKRPQLVSRMVPKHWMDGQWPLNGWLGFSAGSQRFLDQRMSAVVDLPAPVIFVSHEPATGPINIEKLVQAVGPHRLWIITGGMSGPKWREQPMDLDWARYVRDQCSEMSIPFFFKQSSGRRAGMGALLDGVAHHNWPTVPGVLGTVGGVRKAALATTTIEAQASLL